MIKKTCKVCSKQFFVYPSAKSTKYCSRPCKNKAWTELFRARGKYPNWRGGPKRKVCFVCKKEFHVTIARDKQAKYCSLECRYISQKGKPNPNKGKKWLHVSREKSSRWKGGKIKHAGYVMVYRPDHPFANVTGYIFEHRLVMEKHLGRFLKPHERVHHKNHNGADNRIANLRLFADDSEHGKAHHPKGSKFGINA